MNEPDELHAPTPEFRASLKRDISRELRRQSRFTARRSFAFGRLGTLFATAAGTILALGIGLVLGTNTGYASARVEGSKQRNDLAGTVSSVKAQFSAFRQELARTRAALASRAAATGELTQASLLAAEEDLRALEISAARIELDLAQGKESAVPPQSGAPGNVPMKRALSLTCSALAMNPPADSVQPGIPVVDLPEPTIKPAETFSNVLALRQLRDGRLLVNDGGRRQVILFDSLLSAGTVVVDSVQTVPYNYGPYATGLFAFPGSDSSLFTPAGRGRALMVLDAAGRMGKLLTMPGDSEGAPQFVGVKGTSGIDSKGRIVYRSMLSTSIRRDGEGKLEVFQPSDTAAILRGDLQSHRVDTVGHVVQPFGERLSVASEPNGRPVYKRTISPIVTYDEWALMPNGTIAFVRGKDYHIDWLHSDGTVHASAKLPFEWKRLTNEEKQKLVDSTRIAENVNAVRAAVNSLKGNAEALGGGRGARGDGGGRSDAAGGVPTVPAGPGARVGGGGARVGGGRSGNGGALPAPFDVVSADELPDYYPPIRHGAVMPDLEGNLWILPTISLASRNGELVYDVVNERQGLVKRVRLPEGRTLAGFGRGGIVYLSVGDRANGFHIERVTLPALPKR